MATHAPITGAPARAPLQPLLALANRGAIEAEIERLIELLDVADGDPDLEPDQDACPLELCGEANDDDAAGLLPTLPIYALDQAAGPINNRDANNAWRAREMGVVPNGRGGWRWPS